ncbi:MAG: hypothetical protein KAG06_06540 [Methylococcales bacterium]|nr:hypothetical protein [Methylococcales bacterium]
MKNLNGILALSFLMTAACTPEININPKPNTVVTSPEVVSSAAKVDDMTKNLNATLDAYGKILLSGEIEKSLDYAYPAIFKLTSKQKTFDSLVAMKNSGKAPKIVSLTQKADLPVKKYSKGIYTTVPFSMDMIMNITPPMPKADKKKTAEIKAMMNNPKKLEEFKAFMIKMFKSQMGDDVVLTTEKGSKEINIKKTGSYLALNEENKGWKFIDLAPMTMKQAKEILPKDIMNVMKSMLVKTPRKK